MGRGRGAVIGKGGRSGGAHALAQQHLEAAAREHEERGAGSAPGPPYGSRVSALLSNPNKRAPKGKNPNRRVKFRKRLCFD